MSLLLACFSKYDDTTFNDEKRKTRSIGNILNFTMNTVNDVFLR